MQKGDISNRRNSFRANNGDEGVHWVSKRLVLIRVLVLVIGFAAFGIYLWYWFGTHGDKLKNPCYKAYEQEFEGKVVNVFLEKNSKGVVTVQLLQGNDTVEYYTGWGGHKKTGRHIRKGNYLNKKANSFNLYLNNGKDTLLKATQKACK